jgi:hypothetical protein
MRNKSEVRKELSILEDRLISQRELHIVMEDEGVDCSRNAVYIGKTKSKIKLLKWILEEDEENTIDPYKGTEWIPGKKDSKDTLIFHLVNSELHEKYKAEPDHPDYYRGMEYEPYMLWILQSGFQDWHHCIIESGEGFESVYHFLQPNVIKEKFDIEL